MQAKILRVRLARTVRHGLLNGAEEVLLGHLHGALQRGLRDAVQRQASLMLRDRLARAGGPARPSARHSPARPSQSLSSAVQRVDLAEPRGVPVHPVVEVREPLRLSLSGSPSAMARPAAVRSTIPIRSVRPRGIAAWTRRRSISMHGALRRGLRDAVPKRSCSVICTALSGPASGRDNGRLNGAEEVLLGHLHGALGRGLRDAVPKWSCSVICTALSGAASGVDNERLSGAEVVLLGHLHGAPRRDLRDAVPKRSCSVIYTALSGAASCADNERLNGAEEVLLGHLHGALRQEVLVGRLHGALRRGLRRGQ